MDDKVKAEHVLRGERLALSGLTLGWIRKHFSDVTWRTVKSLRKKRRNELSTSHR